MTSYGERPNTVESIVDCEFLCFVGDGEGIDVVGRFSEEV